MKYILIAFVRFWRALISPLYGNVCKYHPSCSAYGLESLQVHGAIKGSWLIVPRLVRCNPWSLGGYDPVPGTHAHTEWLAEQASLTPADLASTTPAPRADLDSPVLTGTPTATLRGDA